MAMSSPSRMFNARANAFAALGMAAGQQSLKSF